MNPGIAAGWLTAVACALLVTGWKRQLIGDVSAARAVCFAAVLLAACIRPDAGLPALSGLPAGAELPQLWTAVCCCAALRREPGGRKLRALGAAAAAGCIWIWCRQLYAADPVFVIWNAQLDGPLAAGLIIAAAAGSFRGQFAAAGAAAIAAEWAVPQLGPWNWLDGFLTALAAARTLSLAAASAKAAAGFLARPERRPE